MVTTQWWLFPIFTNYITYWCRNYTAGKHMFNLRQITSQKMLDLWLGFSGPYLTKCTTFSQLFSTKTQHQDFTGPEKSKDEFQHFSGLFGTLGLPSVLWHCWFWRQEEHLACKNWVVRCWHGYLSGARCKWFEYGPADATTTLLSLASLKSKLVSPFRYQLIQIVLEKRPLNGVRIFVFGMLGNPVIYTKLTK